MNINLSNININTVIMLALAILLAYLGIAVFKVIGRIISISIGLLLLVYVLQQIGITIPVLTNIVKYFMQAINPVIASVQKLIEAAKSATA